MFEGKDLMAYFELQHLLKESGKMTLTEYNNMIPWMLDVEFSLMRRDQEEKKQKGNLT